MFMIREGKSVADAYARLGALRVKVKGLGCEKYNDGFEMNEAFMKCKVIAMIAVKQKDTNLALNLQIITKSVDLNADDLVSYVAANENMAKTGERLMAMNRVDEASHNLALKARVDHEREEVYEIEEDEEMTSTSDIATDFAFFAKKYKANFPMFLNEKKKKKRTCYNCDEDGHFGNECPYEKRVDRPKFVKGVKPRLKPNPINDRYKKNKGRDFFGAEYMSDEEEEDEEKEVGVAGLAFSKPGSLFTYDYSKDYSMENDVGSSFMARTTQDDDSDDSPSSTIVGSCLMARETKTNAYLGSLVTKYGLKYHPNESSCEQATILDENVRLTKELAKFTTAKNEMALDDLLSKQRSNNQKFGLVYVTKSYKKNNYKKEKPAQEKNKKGYSSGGPKWVFDSRCTNHMTGGRGVLDQFIEDINKKSIITFGENSKGKVLGYGKVAISKDLCLETVMLVESLGYNLLSIYHLVDAGYNSYFTNYCVKVFRSDNLKLVLVGYVENNLYVVDLSKESPSPSTCLMAAKHDEGWLWHRRLGHVNMRNLKQLLKGEHIVGLTNISFEKDHVCSACVAGKQLKKKHPIKSIVTTSRPLELLHLDLFGPSHYDTLGGSKYGLVIVDDYSRYSWVFLLKSKDETHRKFIIFAKKAQRMYESEIKAIRTDNGTEFKNYTMQEFVDDEGIKHEFSAPYTPQQNGVVERKNRTIIEMARTILSEFNSPHNFWGEAISTDVHYSNRLFLRPLHNKTPYELLTCGSSGDDHGTVAKRGRHARPQGCRTSSRVPSKAAQGSVPGSSTAGRSKSVANRKKDKQEAQDDDLIERLPTFNVGTIHVGAWRRLREENPYRFEEPTYTHGDKFFWTKTQHLLWDDYYNTPECMKNGFIVMPKAINKEVLTMHQATKYRFVVDTLQRMGLFDLMCLTPDDGCYCPILVRQFHSTVFFHDDPARTMTWMTGQEKYTCNYLDFCEAMGFAGGRAHGFKIYSQNKFTKGDISFCYPPEPTAGPPTISGMYYSYLVLAKLFRENLISKSGDSSECRAYHLNLMYYCRPENQKTIYGCDLLYCELRRSVRERITPNYAQYIQLLINKFVPTPHNKKDQRVKMETFKMPTQGDRPEIPAMLPFERRSKERHDPASSSYSRRPKRGGSRFLTSLWQMCKNTNDVAHQILALNQENRRRQNDFMAARNTHVPPPGPEMEHVYAPTREMPPIDDEMLQNFDLSMYTHGGLPPRYAQDPDTTGYREDDDDGNKQYDEDEDDEEGDGDASDDGSPPAGTEFY
ncbi:hypothetical protein QYE76_029264 [Lolium multiflorum]|uniref:Retrotransposon protein, putative, Ty1-copia subclass n=1 Tax=Lolium multiflorum TaxID=4521 RepID=A0AAD8QNU7_LOLMU|nr:hypothetical protein QYE76_029264 [Lolium multiflorum]